ncbi:Cyclic diguanosine monophosphate-binding protein [Gammaproteobacteria bacterium]
MSSSSDRRRFTRVPFDTRARMTHIKTGQVNEVILLDLCLQGALVELLPESKIFSISEQGESVICPIHGEIMQLELFLDEVETIISMETEVVHVEEKNIGLRCRALDLDSITHLRRLVELNLGNAELFQREIVLLGQPIDDFIEKFR